MSETHKAEHYDYEKQAWIGTDGRYLSCAHPADMNCKCYGRLHYGELAIEEKRLEITNGRRLTEREWRHQ